MKDNVRKWCKGLVAAIVTGVSTSFLSALGITGADLVGINVTQLDVRQLAVITLFGGLIGMFAYLKQSPVPLDNGQ